MAKSKLPSSTTPGPVERLKSEKLETLRLLRGLDAVGVLPRAYASLPGALAVLLAFDEMASSLLLADDGDVDPEFHAAVSDFTEMGGVARTEVLSALPPAVHLRVVGAASRAVATEAEVALELDALRNAPVASGSDGGEAAGPDFLEMVKEVARTAGAIAAADAGYLATDERVARQEAKPLPLARSADAWLQRLPAPWLKTIARLHGLDPVGKKADLVQAIARNLMSPDSLRLVLAGSLDEEALGFLGEFLTYGDVVAEEFDAEFEAAARVPWDWTSRVPAVPAPARLRLHGLAFVGGRGGEPVYAMPRDLLEPVAQALLPVLLDAADEVPPDVVRALEILAGGREREVVFSFDEPPGGPVFLDRPGPEAVLELEVTLRVERPVIRRLLVSSRRSLGSLHDVLQSAFGWEDYHLHQFNSPGDKRAYGPPDPELDPFSAREDEWETAVGDVFPRVGSRLGYEYDFGDDWQHAIRFVARHVPGSVPPEPHCLSGRGACPPEDVGGSWGYQAYLEALADPEHEDHEQMVEWRGPDFDPDRFELDAVNAQLARLTARG